MSSFGKIGDVVTFKYNGGSDYGGVRRIKVTQETLNTLAGIEVDYKGKNIGGYKKYVKDKIRCFSIVTSFDIAKTELETFLRNNNEYAPVIVKEFNKKWDVNYEFKNDRLTEVPKYTSKTVSIIFTRNSDTGDIAVSLAGIQLQIRDTYLYINNIYTGLKVNKENFIRQYFS